VNMPTRDSLTDFMNGNLEAFAAFDTEFDKGVIRVGREIDPAFHDYVLRQLIDVFTAGLSKKRSLKSRLVIDSNIVVGDAFRVSVGKPSSTERLFASPFLELWAPNTIEEEVAESIRDDLPKGGSSEKAKAHAAKLLRKIKLHPASDLKAVVRAQQLISAYDPDDVPFLALAFDEGAEAIVSRDVTSIGQQREVARWDIGGMASVVGEAEGGSLSLVIIGASATAIVTAAQSVFTTVAAAFSTALSVIAAIVGAAVEGFAAALAAIPPDVQAIIGIAAVIAIVVLILGVIFSPDFRRGVADAIEKAADAFSRFAKTVAESARRIFDAVYSVLVWLWNLLLPLTAITLRAAGVVLRRASVLIARCEAKAAGS
jgi:predicted nucleic acid-binding protein